MSGAPAVLLLRTYQLLAGSTTAAVVVPLPSQSPTTGVHPGDPYWNGTTSGAPGALLVRRYQVSVLGSTTPMVVFPSPFQSPATGIQCGLPYANGAISGAPALFVFFRYQTPSGLSTPGVS